MVRWNPKHGELTVLLFLLGLSLSQVAQAAPVGDGRIDPRASLPVRKAGLWEVTVHAHAPRGMRGVKQAPVTVQQCTDARAERVMLLAILPAQENCLETRVAKRGGSKGAGYDIDTVCSTHGQRVKTHMALRGDLRTVYSGRYTAEYPASAQDNSGPVEFQGRWLGSCKPGQRPGDMVLPNGAVVNVVDDVGRAQKHAH